MERMAELVELLNAAARAYYVDDAPVMSDSEYDAAYDELLKLEHRSGTILPDSPSRRVGVDVLSKFEQHKHIARLYSMDKVQSYSELRSWVEKLKSRYPEIEFSLEYKFDGLTINLTYNDGMLLCASSRGNGITGEDITAQVKTIRTIPLTIPFKGKMEVQGEGFMRLSVLERINETTKEQLKNARNAAAGALRNLDPKVTASRQLSCCCYNVGYIEGKSFESHREMLGFLQENGLPVSDYVGYYKDFADIERAINEIDRPKLDILIDGMVVKACPFTVREELGYTDRFPRWAIAYKFPAEEVTTTVTDITWEVGRTGKLTPLAHLEPVDICGATVKRATLNNIDDIVRKRVNIGSRVFIRRSNEVIPEILSSVSDEASKVTPPALCPACGAHLERRGVHIFCTNSLSCKPQTVARLVHFASRNAMDIDTFSDKTAELFVEKLNLTSIPMLYELSYDVLLSLPSFGKRKAEVLLEKLSSSKHCTLAAFLFALGIPGVGDKTAKDIAARFKTLERVRSATQSEYLEINDIGEVVSASAASFFADDRISREIDRLLELGVAPTPNEDSAKDVESLPLFGMTVVVTGKLISLDRSAAESMIEQFGGKASSSVSKKTSLVLAGEDAGSKLDKAIALGVKVIGEQEFFELIAQK